MWKIDPTNFNNIYAIIEHRLSGLNERLTQSIWLFENYTEALKDQLNINVTEAWKFKIFNKYCFMPHNPIFSNYKFTKI